MQLLSRLLGFALVAMAVFMTCSRGTIVENDADELVAEKVTVVATNVSECGGFGAARSAVQAEPSAETLEWAYVSESGTLDMIHSSLNLNCCGARTIDALYADGVVTIFENDQPEPDGGRCRCMCEFDFRVALTGIPKDTTGIRIMLKIDDETTEHWTGSIDLTTGTGMVTIGSSD